MAVIFQHGRIPAEMPIWRCGVCGCAFMPQPEDTMPGYLGAQQGRVVLAFGGAWPCPEPWCSGQGYQDTPRAGEFDFARAATARNAALGAQVARASADLREAREDT